MTEDTRLDPPSLEIAGNRATIRLHRSRHRNRVEPGDIIRIMEHLDQVDANPSLRVLVLAASGPAFSAGFHLGGFAEDKEAAARLGVHYYPTGLSRYVSRLGLNTAKRLFLTAEKLGAEELLRIGYLTHLVQPSELDAAVDQLATTLANGAPLAIQGMKQALNEIGHGRLDAEACAERARLCKESEDIQEGLAAFREKRAPVFRGR